ncbi:MAG TPA: glycosyltransferase family 2 protein [Thermodesulfovibrionales bacterium]|jgi:GT2 family glycosyltransferase|nr:glycosyltransferase family 2 protein [Thermodesulfovibrionales bacterium]
MKISIVLLSFKYFDETTKLCFESLVRDRNFNHWELIVVDNGSDDDTPEHLRALQEAYPSVRFIFSEKNLGFAGGMNTGIREAQGEVIILLNSDTICPEGMINRLAEHCAIDESLGMIGPVTNAAGNEQAIYTSAPDVEGIIMQGLQYANSGVRTSLDAYRLDFCCVAITENALGKTGLLDEGFGRGYFEDFDYSLRMKEQGFRLFVAEDVFIYHRGSTAFGRLGSESRALLKRNKRRIIDKHGVAIGFPHTRECNLSILAQYVQKKESGDTVSQYRVTNRLQLATHDRPRNWLKRRRYLHKVRAVAQQLGVGF